jgi:putative SOS response-associated peptidase YedK
MCGRYSFSDTDGLYERFAVKEGSAVLAERYNVTPGSTMPVIVPNGKRKLTTRRWGITPSWAKAGSRGLINARAETVAEKKTFKELLATGRCLVPASGYYEWQRTAAAKVPYYHHLKDGKLFAFAGLCDDDEYVIVTTAATGKLRKIHDRVPVILSRDQEDEWLNVDIVEPERLQSLLRPLPVSRLAVYAVSKKVNNPRNDGRALIAALQN